MSTLGQVRFACPGCGAEASGQVGIVLNVGRRPDLRADVLGRRLNTLSCDACGRRTRIDRTVALLDFERLQWVVCYPAWAEIHWKDLASATTGSFLRTLGGVPAVDRGGPISAWKLRVVFGPEALREKYVAWDAGLDDTAVEMEKLALLSGSPSRYAARIHLRIAGPPREWGVETNDGAIVAIDTPELVPPDLFNREELRADPFVSYRRWLVVPRAADPLTFDIDGRLNAGGVRDQIRGT